MRPIRRLATILWLALALLVGQQAAALHDLGHATGQLSHKQDSTPGSSTCDQCFACAQLAGAVGTTPPSFGALDASHAPAQCILRQGVDSAPRLAFRSRAPPVLL
jgi:hypothetical protein